MLRRGILLFYLVMSSLIAATTLHAQEPPALPTIQCTGMAHQDGHADQSPGNADKAMPHFHGGCHGHHISIEPQVDAPDAVVRDVSRPQPRIAAGLAHGAVDPGLRPPIA